MVQRMNSPAAVATAAAPPIASTPTVFEAIVRMQCIAASYNRTEVTLAPHVLYTKHGELYLDGVVLLRDGRPPKDGKVGSFKLIGLGGVRLTPRRFAIHPLFDRTLQRYDGETLMMVEPVPA